MRAIYFLAIIAVVAAIFPEAESGSVYSPKQNYRAEGQNGKYYKTSQKLAGPTAPKNESQPQPGRKMIVSAWGIIALIIGVIILSTLTYYIFMLYPYICKREATYDIIELTEVNSVCTVDNVNNVPHELRVYCHSNDISNDVSNDVSLNR
ncbi:PREDICTED: uncharacterized protein LOC105451236 [Wasmannia auropunctata]|uniref:uncharacterized protein LOC105451236 n=1 Tax=Wasmannia auropunctata TaxID=64793 RepID=UPI0005F0AA88|nr:PREDICTED: uncharacterized protein LOC105451236 [Wasmannia auropunctata]